MTSQMQNERCTSSGFAPAKRCRRSRCGKDKRFIMRPLSYALVFVSLLSFAICFPSDSMTLSKSYQKEKVDVRSFFRQNTYASPFQHKFLPEVFVLSLSSASRSPKSDLDRDMTNHKREANRKTNRKTNKITFNTVDSEGQELPLRTIEYRRRKHEWAQRYTSQEGLREAFGSNRNRWWGDLDAKTARRLYKRLLFPTALSELVLELGDEIVRPEELAPLAYEARKAAKMYARERCRVPSRVGAYLFDGFRQLRRYGRFQPNGASYEQLWIRYYEENDGQNNTGNDWVYLFGQDDADDVGDDGDDDDDGNIMDGIDDAIAEDEIVKRTCQKILEKSCTTNRAIDRFLFKEYNINASREEEIEMDSVEIVDSENNFGDDYVAENEEQLVNEKIGRGQRWRNRKERIDRFNDLLLERITKTLEKDVRKLLEPPPSSLSSSKPYGEGEGIDSSCDIPQNQCDQYYSEISTNTNSVSKNENLSSRRMTPQEYHSLKLFAKGRRYSQQHQAKVSSPNECTRIPPSSNKRVNRKNKSISVPSEVAIQGEVPVQDEDE